MSDWTRVEKYSKMVLQQPDASSEFRSQAVARIRESILLGDTLCPSLATQPIRNGVDVRTGQELLGHADLQTTARYLYSDTKAKQEAVGELAEALASSQGSPDG